MRFKDGTHELNARVINSDGDVREFCLGDGIQHVQTDSLGRIWTGYFDEGVFGNFGWGSFEGPTPIGSAGLVCFDQNGKATGDFQPPNGMDIIVDCYAMNVVGDCVWACYYTGFPIIRIDGAGNVTAWQTDLRGPREIAVSGNSVVAFGGYGERANKCVLLKLGENRAERLADVKLVLQDSIDIQRASVIGRGSALYVIEKETLLKFEVP